MSTIIHLHGAPLAIAIKAARPDIHVTVDGNPWPTVTLSRDVQSPRLLWIFGGCIYGPSPRPKDKGFAFHTGYEAFDPYNLEGGIYDPLAGPFDTDEEGTGDLLSAVLRAIPA